MTGSLTSTPLPPFDAYLAAGKERGIAWTDLRRKVLELLWRDGRPRGTYALADEMKEAGRRIYPTSLYRVLQLFGDAGLVVTIASSRRIQIAPDPEQRAWAVLQCSRCERAELLPVTAAADAIRDAARLQGHAIEQLVIETLGICGACAEAAGARRSH